jgi:hypothetical protein
MGGEHGLSKVAYSGTPTPKPSCVTQREAAHWQQGTRGPDTLRSRGCGHMGEQEMDTGETPVHLFISSPHVH